MLHVRYDGRSVDVQISGARLRALRGSSDREVKRDAAALLGISPHLLADHVVDRPPRGALIVRPQAVYG